MGVSSVAKIIRGVSYLDIGANVDRCRTNKISYAYGFSWWMGFVVDVTRVKAWEILYLFREIPTIKSDIFLEKAL